MFLTNVKGTLKFGPRAVGKGNKYFHITITEGDHQGKTAWANKNEFDYVGRPKGATPLPDAVQAVFFAGHQPEEVFNIEHNYPMTDWKERSDTGAIARLNNFGEKKFRTAKRRAAMHMIFALHQIWEEKDRRLALGLPPMTSVMLGNHSLTIKSFFKRLLTRPQDAKHPARTGKQDNGSLTSSQVVWKTEASGERMWTKVEMTGKSHQGKTGIIKKMATEHHHLFGDVPSHGYYMIILDDGSIIKASPADFKILVVPFEIQHSSGVQKVLHGWHDKPRGRAQTV